MYLMRKEWIYRLLSFNLKEYFKKIWNPTYMYFDLKYYYAF